MTTDMLLLKDSARRPCFRAERHKLLGKVGWVPIDPALKRRRKRRECLAGRCWVEAVARDLHDDRVARVAG